MKEKVWIKKGNEFYISDRFDLEVLEPSVYSVKNHPIMGYYLNKEKDNFDFKYKTYGLESHFIDRVCKSFNNDDKNLGVLFHGIKGTGKSVTAKLICNRLNLPVICIENNSSEDNNQEIFINSIPQDIIIFIDEYEKKYDYDSDNLLSIMDGSATSSYKRLFLLTTNSININSNMISRPSRIKYVKSYSSIDVKLQEKIIDDLLENKKKKQDILDFCQTLEIVTVDILKSIIEETNLFNESPEEFYDIFNIKKSLYKYNIFEITSGDKRKILYEKCSTNLEELVYSSVVSDDDYDREVFVNDNKIGKIVAVINSKTVKILFSNDKRSDFFKKDKESPKVKKDVEEIKLITFEGLK